jgi:hypothetical protein
MDHKSLDELGIALGTDKSSVLADYLRHYEQIFAPFRHLPINVLEIGVAEGASLALWSKWFTQAMIVAVDINPDCARFTTDRANVRIGSQTDTEFMKQLCFEYPPTIVIDDGSHQADHIRTTFTSVFPLVLPGGLYVIEDLYLHVGATAEAYRGGADAPPQYFIGDIANKLMGGAAAEVGDPEFSSFASHVDSMTICGRMAVFQKTADGPPRWDKAWSACEHSRLWSNWFHLSAVIAHGGGPPDRAAEAARKATELAPGNLEARIRLAYMLDLSGQKDEARSQASKVLEAGQTWPRMAEFEELARRLAQAG